MGFDAKKYSQQPRGQQIRDPTSYPFLRAHIKVQFLPSNDARTLLLIFHLLLTFDLEPFSTQHWNVQGADALLSLLRGHGTRLLRGKKPVPMSSIGLPRFDAAGYRFSQTKKMRLMLFILLWITGGDNGRKALPIDEIHLLYEAANSNVIALGTITSSLSRLKGRQPLKTKK